MQQSDATSSYYQYYQSHLQNPNPNASSNPSDPHPPHLNTLPATFASAPPVLSGYPPSDYSSYPSSSSSSSSSSTYPPYPQYTEHAPNPPPTYPTNPNSQSFNPSPQPYASPHLNPLPTPYYPYDQSQAALSYDHSIPAQNSNPNPNSNSSFSTTSYSSVSNYENLYDSGANYGRYGDQGMYGDVGKPRPDAGPAHDYGRFRDGVGGGDGVYAYNGGTKEPYGARGSGSESSSRVIFDDYGRPISFSNGKEQTRSAQAGKVVKAIPKAEAHPEVGSGVQKYRVKLLSEGAGQSDMGVLCQVCDVKEAYWIFILFPFFLVYISLFYFKMGEQ